MEPDNLQKIYRNSVKKTKSDSVNKDDKIQNRIQKKVNISESNTDIIVSNQDTGDFNNDRGLGSEN